MTINVPEKLRGWLYVIILLGGPVIYYCLDKGWIGMQELALWTGLTTIVATIARFNLAPSIADAANKVAKQVK
jgi:hypothetical protein